jgi:hypothetical protein
MRSLSVDRTINDTILLTNTSTCVLVNLCDHAESGQSVCPVGAEVRWAQCLFKWSDRLTSTHPGTLTKHIAGPVSPLNLSPNLLTEQDAPTTEMASRLEDLTNHFDLMSRALKDGEYVRSLSDDDMLGQLVRCM